MIRAILFDMGGTLDGDGLHWLERFLALYKTFGVERSRVAIRDAFDKAERKSAQDETIVSSNFAGMIPLLNDISWKALSRPFGRRLPIMPSCSRHLPSAALS
jgi:beta-phosphoglucomutase-like phosphatase (HAD superfamily)